MSNELSRLAQGKNYAVKANNCVDFIHHQDFPNDRKVAYEKFVCDYRPLKSDPYIIGLVLGGEKLDYALDDGPHAALLLINSVTSDAKERAILIICDLKQFFLCFTTEM